MMSDWDPYQVLIDNTEAIQALVEAVTHMDDKLYRTVESHNRLVKTVIQLRKQNRAQANTIQQLQDRLDTGT